VGGGEEHYISDQRLMALEKQLSFLTKREAKRKREEGAGCIVLEQSKKLKTGSALAQRAKKTTTTSSSGSGRKTRSKK
jgi:hypothetical protein